MVSCNSGEGPQYPLHRWLCELHRRSECVGEEKVSYIGRESKDRNEPPEERAAIMGSACVYQRTHG